LYRHVSAAAFCHLCAQGTHLAADLRDQRRRRRGRVLDKSRSNLALAGRKVLDTESGLTL
jgi:hypothetical protein